MQDFPHNYIVSATAQSTSNVELSGAGLETIESAPPKEFGGPGDRWSPESLLVAAVADCFVLSFRAIARASKLEWESLSCSADGVLDRVERQAQFVRFDVKAELVVPAGTNEARALRLLEKAEQACLITNSLIADSHLEATVHVSE
jgi:organic hydroperoxide reductase OsmC/OhrA